MRRKPAKSPTVPLEVPVALAAKLKAIVDHVESFSRRARAKQGRVDFASAELQISKLVADAEGAMLGQYTPAAARVAAALAQETPSRSAEVVCRSAGILPHSRSSQQNVGIELGKRWDVLRPEAEAELVAEMDLPETIVSAAVAVDRISIPMAEPRPPTLEDEHKGVKNPVNVNYRYARYSRAGPACAS